MQLEEIRNNEINLETKNISDEDKINHKVPENYPRYLTIESANIDKARIMELGVLNSDSADSQQLDAPKNIHDAGWYNCQINPLTERKCSQPKLPGDGNISRAAILDGHSCTNHTCIFDELANLKLGDKIIIERGNGSKLNYSVRKAQTVKLSEVDMSKMMHSVESSKEGLNLITCAGNWTTEDNQGLPTMDHRVMVFAVLD